MREGFNTLKLGLKFKEIDDLMSIMANTKNGRISYDDFIAKMDAHVRHRENAIVAHVDDVLFKKVSDCLKYSGESLYDALLTADFDNTGTILKDDLGKVFKRLGLSSAGPNLPRIYEIGGIS